MHCKCDVEKGFVMKVKEHEGVFHIKNVIFPDFSTCLALNAHIVETLLLESIIRNEMIKRYKKKVREQTMRSRER